MESSSSTPLQESDKLNLSDKGSLQSAFENFKKKKQERLKFSQYINKQKKNASQAPRTQSDLELLRKKFIETAKKYIGVPYHIKFHEKGSALYESPLFLDCCGLIRQVVWDLKEEFGFDLGRYNQCYQFDTLPIVLKEEEMRPGDLIFYSGTYYDKKYKKQMHDLVHVEIFLGGDSGSQSIAARNYKGVVQIFDSYKFTSTTYYDIKFYYRSLDTWLEGILKSHCPQHQWSRESNWKSDKYSVFAAAEEIEECEENIVESQKLVFIGPGNNESLIKAYFSDTEKWEILDNRKEGFNTRFYFKWVQTHNEIDFFSFKEGTQIINKISNIGLITTKVGLLQTLRNFEGQDKDFSMKEFFPETYRLDVKSDEMNFLDSVTKGIWILKPFSNNRGRGIKIIPDVMSFKQKLGCSKKFAQFKSEFSKKEEKNEKREKLELAKQPEEDDDCNETESSENWRFSKNSIIQNYIEKPLLIENRKFDIRCYALLASTQPYLVLYHSGYARLCLNEYNNDDFVNKNYKFTHLTNNCIQKKHPNYQNLKESSIWSMNQLKAYLEKIHGLKETEFKEIFHNKIKHIIAYVMRAAKYKLEKKRGTFELLGFDFILDQNFGLSLLEANTNPAISTGTEVLKAVIPNVVTTTLDLIFKIDRVLNESGPDSDFIKNLASQKEIGEFEVIINEACE